MRGLMALAALLLAVPAAAQEADPVVEPTLAVIEFTRAAPFIGVPANCGEGGDICFTELYQGQATTVRHVSGDELPRRFTLRLPGHAMRISRGARMLVFVQPFEDQGTQGYFAQWWDQERFDGLYCVTLEQLERFPDGPVRTAFENGVPRHGRETRDYGEADYLCIWSD